MNTPHSPPPLNYKTTVRSALSRNPMIEFSGSAFLRLVLAAALITIEVALSTQFVVTYCPGANTTLAIPADVASVQINTNVQNCTIRMELLMTNRTVPFDGVLVLNDTVGMVLVVAIVPSRNVSSTLQLSRSLVAVKNSTHHRAVMMSVIGSPAVLVETAVVFDLGPRCVVQGGIFQMLSDGSGLVPLRGQRIGGIGLSIFATGIMITLQNVTFAADGVAVTQEGVLSTQLLPTPVVFASGNSSTMSAVALIVTSFTVQWLGRAVSLVRWSIPIHECPAANSTFRVSITNTTMSGPACAVHGLALSPLIDVSIDEARLQCAYPNQIRVAVDVMHSDLEFGNDTCPPISPYQMVIAHTIAPQAEVDFALRLSDCTILVMNGLDGALAVVEGFLRSVSISIDHGSHVNLVTSQSGSMIAVRGGSLQPPVINLTVVDSEFVARAVDHSQEGGGVDLFALGSVAANSSATVLNSSLMIFVSLNVRHAVVSFDSCAETLRVVFHEVAVVLREPQEGVLIMVRYDFSMNSTAPPGKKSTLVLFSQISIQCDNFPVDRSNFSMSFVELYASRYTTDIDIAISLRSLVDVPSNLDVTLFADDFCCFGHNGDFGPQLVSRWTLSAVGVRGSFSVARLNARQHLNGSILLANSSLMVSSLLTQSPVDDNFTMTGGCVGLIAVIKNCALYVAEAGMLLNLGDLSGDISVVFRDSNLVVNGNGVDEGPLMPLTMTANSQLTVTLDSTAVQVDNFTGSLVSIGTNSSHAPDSIDLILTNVNLWCSSPTYCVLLEVNSSGDGINDGVVSQTMMISIHHCVLRGPCMLLDTEHMGSVSLLGVNVTWLPTGRPICQWRALFMFVSALHLNLSFVGGAIQSSGCPSFPALVPSVLRLDSGNATVMLATSNLNDVMLLSTGASSTRLMCLRVIVSNSSVSMSNDNAFITTYANISAFELQILQSQMSLIGFVFSVTAPCESICVVVADSNVTVRLGVGQMYAMTARSGPKFEVKSIVAAARLLLTVHATETSTGLIHFATRSINFGGAATLVVSDLNVSMLDSVLIASAAGIPVIGFGGNCVVSGSIAISALGSAISASRLVSFSIIATASYSKPFTIDLSVAHSLINTTLAPLASLMAPPQPPSEDAMVKFFAQPGQEIVLGGNHISISIMSSRVVCAALLNLSSLIDSTPVSQYWGNVSVRLLDSVVAIGGWPSAITSVMVPISSLLYIGGQRYSYGGAVGQPTVSIISFDSITVVLTNSSAYRLPTAASRNVTASVLTVMVWSTATLLNVTIGAIDLTGFSSCVDGVVFTILAAHATPVPGSVPSIGLIGVANVTTVWDSGTISSNTTVDSALFGVPALMVAVDQNENGKVAISSLLLLIAKGTVSISPLTLVYSRGSVPSNVVLLSLEGSTVSCGRLLDISTTSVSPTVVITTLATVSVSNSSLSIVNASRCDITVAVCPLVAKLSSNCALRLRMIESTLEAIAPSFDGRNVSFFTTPAIYESVVKASRFTLVAPLRSTPLSTEISLFYVPLLDASLVATNTLFNVRIEDDSQFLGLTSLLSSQTIQGSRPPKIINFTAELSVACPFRFGGTAAADIVTQATHARLATTGHDTAQWAQFFEIILPNCTSDGHPTTVVDTTTSRRISIKSSSSSYVISASLSPSPALDVDNWESNVYVNTLAAAMFPASIVTTAVSSLSLMSSTVNLDGSVMGALGLMSCTQKAVKSSTGPLVYLVSPFWDFGEPYAAIGNVALGCALVALHSCAAIAALWRNRRTDKAKRKADEKVLSKVRFPQLSLIACVMLVPGALRGGVGAAVNASEVNNLGLVVVACSVGCAGPAVLIAVLLRLQSRVLPLVHYRSLASWEVRSASENVVRRVVSYGMPKGEWLPSHLRLRFGVTFSGIDGMQKIPLSFLPLAYNVVFLIVASIVPSAAWCCYQFFFLSAWSVCFCVVWLWQRPHRIGLVNALSCVSLGAVALLTFLSGVATVPGIVKGRPELFFVVFCLSVFQTVVAAVKCLHALALFGKDHLLPRVFRARRELRLRKPATRLEESTCTNSTDGAADPSLLSLVAQSLTAQVIQSSYDDSSDDDGCFVSVEELLMDDRTESIVPAIRRASRQEGVQAKHLRALTVLIVEVCRVSRLTT